MKKARIDNNDSNYPAITNDDVDDDVDDDDDDEDDDVDDDDDDDGELCSSCSWHKLFTF